MHVVGFSFVAIWILVTLIACVGVGLMLMVMGLLMGRPGIAYMGCGVLVVPFVVAKALAS